MHLRALPHRRQTRPRDQQLIPHARHKALRKLFGQWLALHYPERAARVLARVQEMRGGRRYDADFATRMKGHGVWADLVRQRFEKACTRLGYRRDRLELDLGQFRTAASAGQMGLF